MEAPDSDKPSACREPYTPVVECRAVLRRLRNARGRATPPVNGAKLDELSAGLDLERDGMLFERRARKRGDWATARLVDEVEDPLDELREAYRDRPLARVIERVFLRSKIDLGALANIQAGFLRPAFRERPVELREELVEHDSVDVGDAVEMSTPHEVDAPKARQWTSEQLRGRIARRGDRAVDRQHPLLRRGAQMPGAKNRGETEVPETPSERCPFHMDAAHRVAAQADLVVGRERRKLVRMVASLTRGWWLSRPRAPAEAFFVRVEMVSEREARLAKAALAIGLTSNFQRKPVAHVVSEFVGNAFFEGRKLSRALARSNSSLDRLFLGRVVLFRQRLGKTAAQFLAGVAVLRPDDFFEREWREVVDRKNGPGSALATRRRRGGSTVDAALGRIVPFATRGRDAHEKQRQTTDVEPRVR